MLLKNLLKLAKPDARSLVQAFPEQPVQYVIFFSLAQKTKRAVVHTVKGNTFNETWEKGSAELYAKYSALQEHITGLRVDIVDTVRNMPWHELRNILSKTKRNYFRNGISFDVDFNYAILEQEINAGAILYDGKIGVATPNQTNLSVFSKQRFSHTLTWPESEEQQIWTFRTQALYTDGQHVFLLENTGRNSGYRKLKNWKQALPAVIRSATDYLARQIKDSGEFDYGWFPCFDRPIPTYNTLRHASSTYALLEGWELEPLSWQKDAIERSLNCLTTTLIKRYQLPDGMEADFLTDRGNEIKLGGNAVSILAMAKYTQITGDQHFIPQMNRLAKGIQFMQNNEDGSFVHVLNSTDLSVKDPFRIIYYDGEAVFALMRLYAITGENWLLDMVTKAVDHFIVKEHWKAHDHWLSYCINELTLYRPEERYFRFGLDNIAGYLDFIRNRITTFPTLLELIMAAKHMISRIENSEFSYLLQDFDFEKFNDALEHRARHLLNGFFWPEVAMFFRNPQRITGSFFIRHHGFRVRIDDVEHYLSGYVAYLNDISHHLALTGQNVSNNEMPDFPLGNC